jgi:gamma-glutamylaminecyclotransferase
VIRTRVASREQQATSKHTIDSNLRERYYMTTSNSSGTIRVFVYGSLKQGFGNHSLLKDQRLIGPDSITAKHTMVSLGWFPGVVKVEAPDAPDTVVHGELYEVNPEVLDSLDVLEGHPTFYRREKVQTDISGRKAWVYYLQDERGSYPAVEDGVWRRAQ